MTTLQLIENKVPELTQNELLILLERVVHSLKTYSLPSEENYSSDIKENIRPSISKVPLKIYNYEVTTNSKFSREEIYAD
ncbi:MAG: hypothetical protein KA146_09320 [Leptospiraceae bacterium]|nr:hypothetical protein [Leptospiraceae bacterium]